MNSVETFAFTSQWEPTTIQIATINESRDIKPLLSVDASDFVEGNSTLNTVFPQCETVDDLAFGISRKLHTDKKKTLEFLEQYADNSQ